MNAIQPFSLWITGLPASGKSTLTRELVARLRDLGIYPVVLESDTLRTILTPEPTYSDMERDRFYRQMVQLGKLIAGSGVPVVFDATAHVQRYRDLARSLLPRFAEVFLNTPLDTCRNRDPKGIYAAATTGLASTVPGVQTPYEPPVSPELELSGLETALNNASRIIKYLRDFRYI